MRQLRLLLFSIFSVVAASSVAQFHPLGLNPPELNWKQINTPKVQVIYPSESERQAQRVANIVHVLYDSGYYSLGDRRKKVSIILQNQTTISNGFVTVGPFRSEFYVNAPQVNFSGTTDWIDLLTIHEYRHVEQFTNAKKGLTKVSSILFGQNGWGLFAGLALPRWFFEGDAIYYETMLSNSGRGRMPEFQNEYRALLLEDKVFNYEKASATSYKEFVPNHYTLGYFMTTSLRRKYGNDAWEPVVDDAVSYRGLIYPFSRSLRKRTGMRTPQLYRETINDLREKWKNEADSIDYSEYLQINEKRKKTFTNYRFPVFVDNNTIICEKSGYNEIPTYYRIDIQTGKEQKLTQPGIYLDGNATLDYQGNKIIWSEIAYDTRWGNKNYSIIVGYNPQNQQKQQLTSKSRYFAPTYGPNSRIAAIHSPEDQEFELHILEGSSGLIDQRIKPNKPDKLAFPQWISENQIAVILSRNSKNAVALVDINSKEIDVITPFWDDQISYLKYNNGRLYFSGTFSGIDNIYSLDLESHKIYQVTSSRFGATQPDISEDGKKMVYSDYSADGYELAYTELNPNEWTEMESKYYTELDYYAPLLKNETGNILNDVPMKEFESKEFSTKSGLVNVHSWNPYILPPNFGAVISADNKLSTFSAEGSAIYNNNEKTISYSADLIFGEHFPVYDIKYDLGNRSRYTPAYQEEYTDTDTTASINIYGLNWMENQLSAGVTLPLNLTSGNFFSRLWLGANYHHIWVDYESVDVVNDRTVELGTNENFGALDFSLSFYALQRTARQYLNPRYGFAVNVRSQSTLGTSVNQSNYFIVRSSTYLPGLLKNHSFYVNLDYQSEPFNSQFKFRDNFFYARGHNAIPHDKIRRVGLNYAMPLLYPDLALGPVIFLQRIKGNFFYDFMSAYRKELPISELTRVVDRVTQIDRLVALPENTSYYQSVGLELTADFRFMRGLDIDMGFRYSYLLDGPTSNKPHQFDLLVLSIGY